MNSPLRNKKTGGSIMKRILFASILVLYFIPPLTAQQALDEFFGDTSKPPVSTSPPIQPSVPARAPGMPSAWTVMVYIAADNNLDPQAMADVQEMEKVGSTDQVQITVLLDRSAGWKTTRRAIIQRAPEEDVQSMNPNLPTCEDLGEADSGNADTLRDFILWSQRNCPSQRTALILWNHGGGWRSLDCLELEPVSNSRSLTRDSSQAREICSDDSSNSVIYMKDVRQCLEGIGKTYDLIGFDACLMGMLEVAYEVKDMAPYIVASEQVIPGQGYDYTPFLLALTQNPGMDGRALGMEVVDSYSRSYPTAKDVTLCMVDSQRIPALVQNLNEMVGQCGITRSSNTLDSRSSKAPNDAVGRAFTAARQGASPPMGEASDPTAFYDLGAFLENIARSDTASPGLRQAAQTAGQTYQQTILRNFTTLGRSRTGLAIYFPETTNASNFQNYTANNILFARDSLWPAFLQAYTGGGFATPPGPPPPPGPVPPVPPGPPVPPVSAGPKALVVGISDYMALPDLRWPANDANAYMQLLTSHGYSPASILTLQNAQATRDAIRNALITMATSALPGEVLFFAFGGHGAQVTDLDRDEYDRKDEALCPFDARLENPGSLLLDDDLRAIMDLNRGAFWVLFLGSSHSGEGSRNLDLDFSSMPGEASPEAQTRSGELETFFGETTPQSQAQGNTSNPPSTNLEVGSEKVESISGETRGGGFFDLEGGAAGSKDLNSRVAVFSACKSFQIAWGEERSLFVEHLMNGYAHGALVPGLSTFADVSKHLNRRLALMNVFGKVALIAGVPPFGARQVEINGVPVRQDPNAEVPIPMKNLPFLGGMVPRDLLEGVLEGDEPAKSVPDPIELSR
jgi:hypothetical protein